MLPKLTIMTPQRSRRVSRLMIVMRVKMLIQVTVRTLLMALMTIKKQ